METVEPTQRRTSLADVAQEAGVSVSTVAKVANGEPGVAEATRLRVEEILRDRQYVSQRQRQRSTDSTVCVLTRDMRSPYTLDVLLGATSASKGADIVLAIYAEGARDLTWIDDLKSFGHVGVVAVTSVLTARERARFREVDLPVVVIDPFASPEKDVYSIGTTNWAGGLDATEHLIHLGHRRIAMLSGVEDSMASRARVSGHVAGLHAAGITEQNIVAGEYTFESGLETTTKLLSLDEPPTAILAASDFQAMGAIEAARLRGLRVPEDLSVVGFDDLVLASVSSPPLTSVHQPLDQMGAVAVRLVLNVSRDGSEHPRHTELATSLVVRASTAAPNNRT